MYARAHTHMPPTCVHTHTHTYVRNLRDAAIPVDVLAGGAPSGGLGVTTNPSLPLPVVAVPSTDDVVDGKTGNNAIAGTGLCSPSLSVQHHDNY